MKNVDCSIIIPLLNESENIEFSYNKICEVMAKSNKSYELIYVDDGSTDTSLELLRQLTKKDSKVKVVSLSRNFGQYPAIVAGLENCKGKCAIHLDIDMQESPEAILEMLNKWDSGYDIVDMQESPEAILEMLNKWDSGYDIVTVKRKKRKESIFKRITAWFYYKIINFVAKQKVFDNQAEYRLYDRKVIDTLLSIEDKNIYLKEQTNWVGYRQTTIEVDRVKRQKGKTKYNFKKLLSISSQGIVSTTSRPLYWAFGLSFVTHLLSFVAIIVLGLLSILKVNYDIVLWLIPVMLTTSATIMFVLGIIGMYLAYTYLEVKGRPKYIIREKINIED